MRWIGSSTISPTLSGRKGDRTFVTDFEMTKLELVIPRVCRVSHQVVFQNGGRSRGTIAGHEATPREQPPLKRGHEHEQTDSERGEHRDTGKDAVGAEVGA